MGSCDCSYALANIARFRVNIFKQNGRAAIVMRKLQTEIPTLEGLGLPPIFSEMVKEKNGIIFVTGATGSGKTTTLAAMLNELNRTQQIHILTLEDPIEFLHPHKRALFNQRELGKDFPDFASGLRAALRQAPKAILVGEVRDRATMEIAMTASETGHIVFTTMHTINAGQTINRVLGMFAKDEEQQLRQRMADTIRYRRQSAAGQQDQRRAFAGDGDHGKQHANAGKPALRRSRKSHFPRDHRSGRNDGLAQL